MSERDRLTLGPFLSLLKPSQLSLLTIMEILRLHGSGGIAQGMKTARALISVGAAVEQEYGAALRKREMSRRYNLEKFYTDDGSEDSSGKKPLETAGGLDSINARREAAKKDAEVESKSKSHEWSRAIQARIGSLLVDALMDTAMVTRTIENPESGET